MLRAKFQLLQEYERGTYDPGYPLTISSIAGEFKIKKPLVTTLYMEWMRDQQASLSRNKTDRNMRNGSFAVQPPAFSEFSTSNFQEEKNSPHMKKIVRMRFAYCRAL